MSRGDLRGGEETIAIVKELTFFLCVFSPLKEINRQYEVVIIEVVVVVVVVWGRERGGRKEMQGIGEMRGPARRRT